MPIDVMNLRRLNDKATPPRWPWDHFHAERWKTAQCTGDDLILAVQVRNDLPELLDQLHAREAEIAALRAVLANQTELLDECRDFVEGCAISGGPELSRIANKLLEKLSPPEGDTNES
jgi:hypothetical protein